MFQMNPKEVFHNTAYSVQLPYIAGQLALKQPIICIWVVTKQIVWLVTS